MYILEHPTRGILVDEPDCDKESGTWSWARPRTAARRFNFREAVHVLNELPAEIRQRTSILVYGTWLIAREAQSV